MLRYSSSIRIIKAVRSSGLQEGSIEARIGRVKAVID